MSFTKHYITSDAELEAVPIKQRFKYYLDRNLLARRTNFSHPDEPMVGRSEIEAAGIRCMPFWEDETTGNTLDSEGIAFQAYRARHPKFDVMIRREVLPRLLRAQKALPRDYRLAIKASYRPVSVQKEIFNTEMTNVRQSHPNWSAGEVYKYTLEFVTDPHAFLPPHASGGTLDVQLWDEANKRYVDVGSPVNAVDDTSWGEYKEHLNNEQIANRDALRDSMLAAGFANLASEWWHYSYGDQRWAVYYDKQPRYGAVGE